MPESTSFQNILLITAFCTRFNSVSFPNIPKTPLYQDKHGGGMPTNVTDSRHELRLLVDQQHQAGGDIIHILLFWHAELLIDLDMAKRE